MDRDRSLAVSVEILAIKLARGWRIANAFIWG
jgi:hypothetical protein